MVYTFYLRSHRRRPVRKAPPALLADPQARLPEAWCPVCGREIFREGRDRCPSCRKEREA